MTKEKKLSMDKKGKEVFRDSARRILRKEINAMKEHCKLSIDNKLWEFSMQKPSNCKS